jgi:phosphatidylglycerophosphatase A
VLASVFGAGYSPVASGTVGSLVTANQTELTTIARVQPVLVTFTVPAFHVHGVEIWGATAMVLAEFLALLGWAD